MCQSEVTAPLGLDCGENYDMWEAQIVVGIGFISNLHKVGSLRQKT